MLTLDKSFVKPECKKDWGATDYTDFTDLRYLHGWLLPERALLARRFELCTDLLQGSFEEGPVPWQVQAPFFARWNHAFRLQFGPAFFERELFHQAIGVMKFNKRKIRVGKLGARIKVLAINASALA